MFTPGEDRTPPMTPQLALRVAIIGGIALVLFAVIFFRLWFLQILTGGQYVKAAQVNSVRSIPVAAPRGEIVDRNGTPLVQSVPVPAIQISPESLPAPVSYTLDNFVQQPAKDYTMIYDPLAKLLGMSTKPVPCKFEVFLGEGKDGKEQIKPYDVKLAEIPCLVAKGVVTSQYANVTIKTDVSTDIQDYLAERITQFPGVDSQHDVYVRKYTFGSAGAQMLGTLGPISETELGTSPFKGVTSGSIVGQSGLEYEYNADLQGTDGEDRVKVNSQNQFEGYAKGVAAIRGDTLKLSIDAGMEKVGQQSLAESISRNGGEGGAFEAIDPQNGSVYAMGSAPTYDPAIFNGAHPVSDKTWAFFQNPLNNTPLLNRAIAGVGADGSTFKVITATAALESGAWSLADSYPDTGEFCFPHTTPADCKHNSGGAAYGPVGLETAIQKSVDTFFYNLGYQLNADPKAHPNGGALQQWAKQFGVGQQTGVDLPGEASGAMSSPAYSAALWKLELECENATGQYKGRRKQPAKFSSDGDVISGGCGIAQTKNWTVGNNVNAAVGQGDDQLTPTQLAVVYAAIANGGTIVTPHIGMQVQSPTGTILKTIDPAPKRHLDISADYLSAIQQGLNEAAQSPDGTSYDVMGDFPQKVYGKTGTAQYVNSAGAESDYAWYACYVPATATKKPIVVVVWVPKGGFGDVAAAPVARQILNQWFYGKAGQFIEGTEDTL